MKKFVLCISAICFFMGAAAQQVLRGRVVNGSSGDALPFVNITITGLPYGATTDVEGRFSLTWEGNAVDAVFSFVGFEPLTLHVVAGMKPVVVKLHEQATQLREFVVRPEDNPALKIISRVIHNKDVNDPENLPSFSYHTYNKLYMTMTGAADSLLHRTDSVKTKPDSITIKKENSFKKFLADNHIFMSESYTERKYVKPRRSIERVLGNRMTGIKDPFFAFMATDFQPFSFYTNYLSLFGVDYLNPISHGSFSKYDFTVTDTIYHLSDSIFIVAFEPLPGKSFQALKGQLYISSDGYALEHVLAETADPKALIEFHIQQKYARASGHWFPVQLNSELRFTEYKIANRRPRYVNRSYLSDIRIGVPIPKKEFGLLNVEFDAQANYQKEIFWQEHRSDSLTPKEKNTYTFYKKKTRWSSMLNNNFTILEALIIGRFRAGAFYVPLDQLIRINNYEGVRIGLGLETSEQISRLFTLAGYGAYGFKDKALKYGASVQLNWLHRRDGFLKISASNDIGEPGISGFIKKPVGAISNETLRNWLVYRMDSVRSYKAEVSFRPARFSQVGLFVQQQQRDPTYTYSFVTDKDAAGSQRNFIVAEAGFQWRLAWKENYTQMGTSKVVTNIAAPELNFYVSRGFKGVGDGQFNYTKIEVKLDHQLTTRGFGKTILELNAGKITGDVPYPFLFNGRGSNYNRSFFNSFVINNYFQTMGFYEFASDKFAYLFLNHNFGRLTGTKSAIFRPELSLVHNMGVGSLKNRDAHQGIAFSTMEKGYFESGAILNNIVRFKYVNLFYFGLGVGAFYRYGDYALPKATDNYAFKFMLTASL